MTYQKPGVIREPNAVKGLFATYKFDAVLHFAALTDEKESAKRPGAYHKTNTGGTLNILQACVDNEVKQMVFASSAAVYGADYEVQFRVVKEDDMLIPMTPYAMSKLSAEMWCDCYSRMYGINVEILRYFDVYGPCSKWKLLHQIVNGETIEICGDGTQKSDMVFIDDAVAATMTALYSYGNHTLNIGTGFSTSLKSLISIIEECVGESYTVKKIYRANCPDIIALVADIELANSVLDWLAEVSVAQGVRRTVEWYCDNEEKVHYIFGEK